jgi:hypothetical protein
MPLTAKKHAQQEIADYLNRNTFFVIEIHDLDLFNHFLISREGSRWKQA